jgi:CheY-like chemotaxis protein
VAKADWNLAGLHILLVEDDDDTREVLTLGLTLYGAEVVAVNCAAAAVEELEKSIPDVILSDIGLPDVDGLELMRRVRQRSPARGGLVPAVAVTAFTLRDDAQEVTRAGFQRHFRKPVDTKALFSAVNELARIGRIDRRLICRRALPPPQGAPLPLSDRRVDIERRLAPVTSSTRAGSPPSAPPPPPR